MIAAGTCAGLGQRLIMPAEKFMAFGAVGSGRRLVFIHAAGGWSLNVAPPDHGTYRTRMAPIYPTSTLSIGSGDQFLHPSLINLYTRYQQGQLLVLNKVANPLDTRSHETESGYYLSGLISGSMSTTVDRGMGARIACLDPANPLAAVSFSGNDAWSGGACNPAIDIDNLDNLGERPFRWWDKAQQHFSQARDAVHAAASNHSQPRETFMRTAVDNVSSTLASLQAYKDIPTGASFPNTGLGGSLSDIASMIIGQQNSALRTATFLTSLGGFDTHSNEVSGLQGRLGELDGALEAFMQSMAANNLSNEVAVIVFGEFGRTFSNGSGTDHGKSQRVFVLGGRVNGGRVANSPESPAECGGQYVTAYDFDFRSVFRQFVEGGLGISGSAIFPEPIAFGDNSAAMFR